MRLRGTERESLSKCWSNKAIARSGREDGDAGRGVGAARPYFGCAERNLNEMRRAFPVLKGTSPNLGAPIVAGTLAALVKGMVVVTIP